MFSLLVCDLLWLSLLHLLTAAGKRNSYSPVTHGGIVAETVVCVNALKHTHTHSQSPQLKLLTLQFTFESFSFLLQSGEFQWGDRQQRAETYWSVCAAAELQDRFSPGSAAETPAVGHSEYMTVCASRHVGAAASPVLPPRKKKTQVTELHHDHRDQQSRPDGDVGMSWRTLWWTCCWKRQFVRCV